MRKKIAVFIGSSFGNDVLYIDAAKKLGELIAKNNDTLIFGGSHFGLMGILADAVLQYNGEIHGYTCKAFASSLHPKLTLQKVYDTLFESKQAVIRESDAFIVFPGGIGTLDELFEVLALKSAGIINKPIAILNTNHIFTPLLEALSTLSTAEFIAETQLKNIHLYDTPEELVYKLFPMLFSDDLFQKNSIKKTTDPAPITEIINSNSIISDF